MTITADAAQTDISLGQGPGQERVDVTDGKI